MRLRTARGQCAELRLIRLLRNRIAHHEPIFNRNLTEDYAKIMSLIHYRCNFTAMWLSQSQIVSTTIKAKP